MLTITSTGYNNKNCTKNSTNSGKMSTARSSKPPIDLKNHCLPLARIKKIMKADEDVKMISAEAPVIFAKACEMFIMELTMRAWAHAEENKRRTLQKNDIAAAVTKTDVFDFLVDVVPSDETMDLDLYAGIRRGANNTAPSESVPCVPCYYYMPPQHVVGPPHGPPKVVMGRHVPSIVGSKLILLRLKCVQNRKTILQIQMIEQYIAI